MYVGQSLPRPEDFRFLTGRGNFVDDIKPPNCVYLAFLRSPHAHAKIVRIDPKAALACSGVLRILTAEDWTKAGLGKLVLVNRKARNGRNPQTGEAIKIPAKRVVKFRVAKAAKDAILGSRK